MQGLGAAVLPGGGLADLLHRTLNPEKRIRERKRSTASAGRTCGLSRAFSSSHMARRRQRGDEYRYPQCIGAACPRTAYGFGRGISVPVRDGQQPPCAKGHNAHDRAVRDSKVAPFRLYDLRHTWATRASMSGIDLVTLAAMLGHSRIQMVLRYAHPTQQHQHQAMEKLERFVSEQRIAHAERMAPRAT